jgi:hypothetical protein
MPNPETRRPSRRAADGPTGPSKIHTPSLVKLANTHLRLVLETLMDKHQIKVEDWMGNTYYIPVNPSSTEVSTSGKTFKVGFQSIKVTPDITLNINVFAKRHLANVSERE